MCIRDRHEINFLYGPVLETADNHSIYKTGAKEIAWQEGCAITYMAKFDEREGNSCHIHLSIRNEDGSPAWDDAFLAGQLDCLRDLTLFYAPNVNSYKRYVEGSFAPTAVAWGHDNRTCALRVVGHSPATKRLELRFPGADVNPYLALSAIIAAGLHGMDNQLPLEDPYEGNAYASDKPRVPDTLGEARDLFGNSDVVREAFGQEVMDHYLNYASIELAAYNRAVTDWERFRGFERL